MKIDLQQAIGTAEELLAGMRALDGTETDDQARGRAAREQRADLVLQLQVLAHQADVVRLTLVGAHLGLRNRDPGRTDDTAPGPEAAR